MVPRAGGWEEGCKGRANGCRVQGWIPGLDLRQSARRRLVLGRGASWQGNLEVCSLGSRLAPSQRELAPPRRAAHALAGPAAPHAAQGVKVTERERRELEYKEQVYRLAMERKKHRGGRPGGRAAWRPGGGAGARG